MDSIRELIKNNRLVSVIVLLVISVLALTVAVFSMRSDNSPEIILPDTPYYNEVTKQIVMMPPGQVPPITGNEGAILVRAYMNEGSKDSIRYLEKYTPEGQAAAEQFLSSAPLQARAGILNNPLDGQLVRLPQDDSPWIAGNTAAGRAITGHTDNDGHGH